MSASQPNRLGPQVPRGARFEWTDLAVEALKAMRIAGLTASKIAKKLGTTRNAICGKVDRLDLPPIERKGDGKAKKPRIHKSRAGKATAPRKARVAPPTQLSAPPLDGLVEFMELTNQTCKFHCELNDQWCGRPSVGSWCPEHRAVVYRPVTR